MGAVLHVVPFRRISVVPAVLATVAVCADLLSTPAATDASVARFVGLRGYLASNATSTVLIHVDNFRVAAP